MFGDDKGTFDQLHLLDHMPVIQRDKLARSLQFVVDSVVDPLGGKRLAFMLGMPVLAANLPLAAMERRGLGRLDDVAGGRLGGVRRILLEAGDLGFEGGVLRFQFRNSRHQRRNRFGDEAFDFRVTVAAFHSSCCNNSRAIAQIASANNYAGTVNGDPHATSAMNAPSDRLGLPHQFFNCHNTSTT
jgi:hypothetical protein